MMQDHCGLPDGEKVEFWDHLFAVNVRAPFILSQECVQIMKREKTTGSIVNIISVAAYCGLHNLTAYSSTKGALSTFTKNIAHGLSPDRIRVNGIMLGWTDTPNEHVVQREGGQPDNWLELAEANSDYGRLIKPIDVARLSVYLLSNESGIVTGSLIDYAQRVFNKFHSLSIIGFSSILYFHMLINMCMVVGLFPVIGLPFPFISYGGSFLLSCFMLIAIINNIVNNDM